MKHTFPRELELSAFSAQTEKLAHSRWKLCKMQPLFPERCSAGWDPCSALTVPSAACGAGPGLYVVVVWPVGEVLGEGVQPAYLPLGCPPHHT